jgi:chromosome segregation ATPase
MTTQETGITKEDLKSFKEEIVQQFHVSAEGIRDEVKQLAEGIDVVDKKVERTRQELKEEIDNKTQPIAQAVVALNSKVAGLDNKVTVLHGKVTALDAKVDKSHLELKTEIREVLAAVKFSYAELDKRLTTLEQEFLDLKLRVEKIENRSSV